MTIQEKSKELVWKYYHNIEHTISNEYASKDWEIAKQCALIAVDDIIEALFSNDEHITLKRKFFLEVKQELEKL